jgi:SGNH domain (fused to AT3 domains)
VHTSPADWAVVLAALLGIALVLGTGIVLLEQPGRVGNFRRARRWSVVGLCTVLVAIVCVALLQSGPTAAVSPSPSSATGAPLATVLRDVKESDQIRTLSPGTVPPLSEAIDSASLADLGVPAPSTGCWPGESQSTVPACIFGDRTGSHTMVLYGDSHAGMWFQALDDIATRAHWRLVALVKGGCPAAPLSTQPTGGGGDLVACDQWHRYAIDRINRIAPSLLVVSQASYYTTPEGIRYTPTQWQRGMSELLSRVTASVKAVIGNLAGAENLGPLCLSQHVHDVQVCSILHAKSRFIAYDHAERRAAALERTRYIDVTPWFCDKTCGSVIASYDVYFFGNHVAVEYSRFLEGVLAQSLGLN